MHVPRKMLFGGRLRGDFPILTKPEIALKGTPICRNSIGGQAKIALNLKPDPGMLSLGSKWVAFRLDICHDQLLPMRKELLFFFSVLYWMSCILRNLYYAPGWMLPPSGKRLKPGDYNAEAVQQVSKALGHNRKDVVLRHYLL